ncbi:MAG: rhamnulokinase, partial [bacterium]|nr:rhamnulokinase [bacterium]
METYYLAIDIGASSGRHILGSVRDGRLVLEEIYRFSNGTTKKNGHLCWDVERLRREIVAGMRRCKELGKVPVSVGVDTWAVDFVLLDAQDQIIGDTIAYRDAYTAGMDQKVYERIAEEELYRRTGIQKQIFNSIYQIQAWKERYGEQFGRAKSLLMLPDYFHYVMTGKKATEYTNATSTQLIDPDQKDWDRELIGLLGYPNELFQQIVTPGSSLGMFTDAFAEEVGFTAKVVVPATHDTGSAVAAVPTKEKYAVYLSSGTWSLLGCERAEPELSEESRRANFTNEGGYQYRYRYLKNIMGLWMIQSLKRELHDRYSFAELCNMAGGASISSIVDCNSPIFLAPQSMTEAVRQACRESGQNVPETPAQLAKVIYASLAACYGDCVRQMERITGVRSAVLHVVGGGANADYLNRLTAEATGKTVLAGPTEATAAGNLIVQMIAEGVFFDLKSARECIYRAFDMKI